MAAKVLMVQGTGSSAGKSLLVTGLCRVLRQDGYRVAPFKAQNMALNAAVTLDGLEIGRAQAVQAEAAGIEPTVEMNPILLKPEGESRCQLVLMGRPVQSLSAREYYQRKSQLWETVRDCLDRLRGQYDVVIVEGAGSPAEVNLRESDLVNMRVALYAQSPVLLVGNIDLGGVFASLIGTLDLLLPEERALVRGLIINKFRGDSTLFESGVRFLAERTGLPVLGVLPYLRDLLISEEDSVGLEAVRWRPALLDVVVIRLPRIANFDDFDLLAAEPAVGLRYVDDPILLGRPDLVIIPGSKGTVADLASLRDSGLARAVVALAHTGTPVMGICGGYQMMGERILDPDNVESAEAEISGLGLLPATTTFVSSKRTARVSARVAAGSGPFGGASGQELTAYEIHMGTTEHRGCVLFDVTGRETKGYSTLSWHAERGGASPPRDGGAGSRSGDPSLDAQDDALPWGAGSRSGDPSLDAQDDRAVERSGTKVEGCISVDGNAMGTYLHGLFENQSLRRALVDWLVARRGLLPVGWDHREVTREAEYDRLADCLRRNLDLPAIYSIMGLGG